MISDWQNHFERPQRYGIDAELSEHLFKTSRHND